MRTIIGITGDARRPGRNEHGLEADFIEMEKAAIDGREIYTMKNEARGNNEEKTIS